MTAKPSIAIFGKTDMGCVRTNNEDAFVAQMLWDHNTYLAIAIDGVGGYEGGEIAAAIASKTIPEFLSASSNGERVELLKQAVTAANNAIFEAREADPNHGQMSCVLTAAIIDVAQKQISMAHVGDSRLYSYHRGELKKLSHDHSIVGFREEIGDLSEEEAMHHPQRNVIGRDVGSQKHKVNDDDFIEAQVFPLLPNTTLLFCSDGLTDLITSATISSILRGHETIEDKADRLINAALNAGGKDNVTVVLFEYQDDETEIAEAEEEIKAEEENESTQMINEDEKVKENNMSLRAKSPKKSIGVVLFFVVFICGFIAAYMFLYGRVNMLKSDIEQQKKNYSDSILVLQNTIVNRYNLPYTLDNRDVVQLTIDDLLRQNDSLRVKLFESEKQREQLEKEVKLFVDQIEALKGTIIE